MALGDGEVYYGSLPDNNTNLSDGDDYILHNSKFVQVRQTKEHVWPSTQPASATAGYHKHITFQPYASGTTPGTFVTGTTAGAIGMCSTGTGYGMYVAVAATDRLLFNDAAVFNASLVTPSGQTAGDVFVSTGTSGISRVAGSTGQHFILSGTVATFSNSFSVAKTFSEDVTCLKNITVSTLATVGFMCCTGTSTFSGNALLAASGTVAGYFSATNQFGAWAAATYNAAVQVLADSFLIVTGTTAGGGTTFKVLTDSSNPPTTKRGEARLEASDQGQTITCPIRKGDYYKITISGVAGTEALTGYVVKVGA